MRSTFAIIPLACLISAACSSTPSERTTSYVAPRVWQNQPWRIQLHCKDTPHSFYQIERSDRQTPGSLRIPSAFDRSHLSSDAEIAAHIRIHCSASGDTILIHEQIPNDAYGCENNILIRLRDDQYHYTWLHIPTTFPEGEFSPNEMPPPAITADIRAITDHSLHYRYSDDGARKVRKTDKRTREIPFSALKQSSQMALP